MSEAPDTARLERNLVLIDVFYAAQSALFWLPVFVLYFSEVLAPAEVLRLEAVYYAAIVVLEVPSGWLSDRAGRRWTLVLSGLGWALGALVMGLSGSFAAFALGQIFLAAGRSFASGTDSSMLFETLRALGREDEMRVRSGRANAIAFATLGLASLVGGAIGWSDLAATYLASVVSGAVAVMVALAFVEPPRSTEQPTPAEQFRVLREAASDPVVRQVFAVVVAMTVFVHIPYELQQPWLDVWLGVGSPSTPVVSGALIASGFLAASMGSRLTAPLVKRLDPDDRGVGFARGAAIGMVFIGIVMGGMALGPYGWVVPLLAVRSIPTGMLGPLAEAEIHPRLPSAIRATWLSIQSLGGRLAFSLVLVGVSVTVGESWTMDTLRQILAPFAALALLGAIVGLVRGTFAKQID